MKQYLLSILYLLAALVQPAIAQNSPQTKAAPAEPVMPYVVTIVQPTTGNTANLLTVTTDYPTKTTIKNGDIAYNGKKVKLSIKRPPHGYFLADGFPKVYERNNSDTPISITQGTFTMPKAPVTIEVQYIKVEDLDLSKLSGNDVTLTLTTYDNDKWMYKQGESGTYTRFTGTVTGKGACKLTINTPSNPILILANGTELTGNIELGNNTTDLSLQVEEGGTATVRGDITVSNFSAQLSCNGNGRLNIYGEVTGGNIYNLMQWTWTAAPKAGQTISLSTPLELLLTTFIADGSRKIFTSYLPENTPVKVKVGDTVQKVQKDGTSTTTFKMDPSGTKTSVNDLEDSELLPAKNVDGITITGEDKYKPGIDGTGSDLPFSGTVTGKVSTIKVDAAVKDNPVIILEEVKKKDGADNKVEVEVAATAEVTLALKGESNDVSKIDIASGGTLTLTTVAGGGSFATPPTINNAGTFIAENAVVTKVEGAAALDINGKLNGGGTVTEGSTITLTASTNDNKGTITFTWQKKDANGSFMNIDGATKTFDGQDITKATGTAINYEYKVDDAKPSDAAEYRCEILRQALASGDIVSGDIVSTTLITEPTKVEVKSGGDPGPGPDPTPTKYSVTLPAVTGATTDPVAGVHTVNEGVDFSFSLTLKPEYSNSTPVVTVADKTLTPNNGSYKIEAVTADIIVTITSIVKNEPVTPPTPEPVYYNITLPAPIGATLNPGTGNYSVLENSSFEFTLTLDKDYDQSAVIVSTNRDGEIQADSDGWYTISRIGTDITVSIEGIVKNSTVGNAVVEPDGNRVWTDGNLLCIRTNSPQQVHIYNFNGTVATTFSTSGGEYQTQLSTGTYVVLIAGKSYKVAVSNF